MFSIITPCIHKSFPTDTPRRIHVDSSWILRRYLEDQISTNFHVISTYFFGVISLIKKSTLFPRTFFDVISMIEKPTLFPRNFCDVISMVEKSTLFPFTFFDVVSMVEKSTVLLIFWLNFDCRKIHFVCAYFFRQNFDEFYVIFGKLWANENIRGIFPLLVTLKSWL